jgi:hypothetical protein
MEKFEKDLQQPKPPLTGIGTFSHLLRYILLFCTTATARSAEALVEFFDTGAQEV